MKKVIQIFNKYKVYGGEEFIVNEIERMLNSRNQVEVMGFYADSNDWKGFWSPPFYKKIAQSLYNKEVESTLDRLLTESKASAMIAHNVYPILSRSVYKVCADREVPIIQYLHNYRPFSVSGTLWSKGQISEAGLEGNMWPEIRSGAWQGSVLKSLVIAHVLKKFIHSPEFNAVSKWIACSNFVKSKFVHAGIPEDKIITLRHGWNPKVESNHFLDEGYYLLLSRLVPEKGISVAIDAWRILEKRLGEKCPKLVIAGSGHDELIVKKAISELRSLRFVNFVSKEKKYDLLSKCRATLAPSIWHEPLGLVTYESYDHSKPILAASSGGLTETIIDGVTGLLHEAGNAEGLAATVMTLESKSELEIRAMGCKGREWLLKEASYDQWVDSLTQIINNVS
jgi:glycosyltransferase involved in cell wall biosynthesis